MDINAPSHVTVKLDTTHVMFATDSTGKQLMDENNGKPVQIAQDTLSGKWYRKIADSWPHFGSKKALSGDFQNLGAVHVPHDNEAFRGVWAPMSVAPIATSEEPGESNAKAN